MCNRINASRVMGDIKYSLQFPRFFIPQATLTQATIFYFAPLLLGACSQANGLQSIKFVHDIHHKQVSQVIYCKCYLIFDSRYVRDA